MLNRLTFTALALPRQRLGESPFWHAAQKRLYWCDIKAHTVQAYEPLTQQHCVWEFATEPACIAPATHDRVVVALRGEVQLLNTRTGKREKIADIPHDVTQFRSNDGKCDTLGRFWVGSVFEPKTAEDAALWMLHAQGERYDIKRMLSGNITANGLAFSADGTQLYWAHTAAHRVDVVQLDMVSATLTHRRLWVQFADKAAQEISHYGGRPDGAAMDTQGCYWTAMYEGACLLRISPKGEVLEKHTVPTRYPTMPCFGGDDMRTLYLTSATGSASGADDEDGKLFAARVDVPGVPANYFRCTNEV
jgi:sugar lactone lactonase YvrE